jgi:hypothetical protein
MVSVEVFLIEEDHGIRETTIRDQTMSTQFMVLGVN